MKITAQQLRAMFLSKSFNAQIQTVICNIMFNGYAVDHVLNRFGHAVLAFRVYGGKLHITDRSGADVTDLYLITRG